MTHIRDISSPCFRTDGGNLYNAVSRLSRCSYKIRHPPDQSLPLRACPLATRSAFEYFSVFHDNMCIVPVASIVRFGHVTAPITYRATVGHSSDTHSTHKDATTNDAESIRAPNDREIGSPAIADAPKIRHPKQTHANDSSSYHLFIIQTHACLVGLLDARKCRTLSTIHSFDTAKQT